MVCDWAEGIPVPPGLSAEQSPVVALAQIEGLEGGTLFVLLDSATQFFPLLLTRFPVTYEVVLDHAVAEAQSAIFQNVPGAVGDWFCTFC